MKRLLALTIPLFLSGCDQWWTADAAPNPSPSPVTVHTTSVAVVDPVGTPTPSVRCDPDGDGDDDSRWYAPGTCPTQAEWRHNHDALTSPTPEPTIAPTPPPYVPPTTAPVIVGVAPSPPAITTKGWVVNPLRPYAGPPAGWVPYTTGPLVQVVPPNPTLAPGSAAMIAAMWAGHSSSDVGHIQVYSGQSPPSDQDWSLPTYFGTVHDPVYTIACSMYGGACRASGIHVHIPRGAYPAGGTDHHLSVRDFVTGLDVCLWEAPVPNGAGGTLSVGWAGYLPSNSAGIGTVGCTASGLSELWTVRAVDLEHNSINHAMLVSVTAESKDGWVYPAIGWDNAYFHADPWPEYGAHFWLDVAPPYASNCPQYAVSYLTALNKYGAFFADVGGTSSPIQPQLESDVSYTSQGGPSMWGPLAASIGGSAQGNTDIPIDPCGINIPAHLHILAPPAVAVAP